MLSITRKLGGALRGGAHPAEVAVGVFLGVLAGVSAGENGLWMALVVLTLVLNTNKPAFALAGAACGALGWLLSPLKFSLGQTALANASVASLAGRLAGAPVGAFLGFDTYSVIGAVALGLPAALVVAVIAGLVTRSFRRKMLSLVGDEQKASGWAKGRFARLMKWILLGAGEVDYSKTLAAKPKIIRWSGVVLLGLLAAGVAALSFMDYGPPARPILGDQMTSLAGAQVDVAELSIKPVEGSLGAKGLALTDASDPSRNVIEIGELKADISTSGLLARSVVIEEAVLSSVALNTPRKSPGKVLPGQALPAEPPAAEEQGFDSLDQYMSDWETWRGRLKSLKEYMKKVDDYRARSAAPPAGPETPEELAARAAREGYGSIRAREVARAAPDVLVKKLLVGKLPTAQGYFATVDVLLENVAYPPSLALGPTMLTITDCAGAGKVTASYDASSPSSPAKVTLELSGLPAKPVSDALSGAVPIAFEGGSMKVTGGGELRSGKMNLTLDILCTDVTSKSRGKKSFLGLSGKELDSALTELKELRFQILVRGDPAHPRVSFKAGDLADALKDAAVKAAKKRAQEEIDKQKDKLQEKAKEKLGDAVKDDDARKKAGDALEKLFKK